MAYSNFFLDQIREQVGLVGLISQKVKLTKKGHEYSGLCPFHEEKTPSFTVNEQKNFYHCFGCGAHGDVIEFFMKTRGASFQETIEALAQRVGIPLPDEGKNISPQQQKSYQRLYDLLEQACVFFQNALQQDQGAHVRAYLNRRGVHSWAVDSFRLGYAPDSYHALIDYLKGRGYSLEELKKTGMMNEAQGQRPYDRFRDRVMFPILDHRGRVVAFGGRSLNQNVAAKYLNSPQTPLFHKGRLLYGMDRVKGAIKDHHTLIVTEGYLDVIALHSHGFKGAVAPLGTALTQDQLLILWRMHPEPVICFDGDLAGGRAAMGLIDKAFPHLTPGKSLKFMRLADGQDPDSVMNGKDGKKNFEQLLTQAIPFVEVFWRLATYDQPIETPEQRAGIEAKIKSSLSTIKNDMVRIQYDRFFKDRLFHFFRSYGQRSFQYMQNKKKYPGKSVNMTDNSAAFRGLFMEQLKLLACVIFCPRLMDVVHERFAHLVIENESLEYVRRLIMGYLMNHKNVSCEQLVDFLKKNNVEQAILNELISPIMKKFIRYDEGFDQICQVWENVYVTLKRPDLKKERDQISDAFLNDISEINWDRKILQMSSLKEIEEQSMQIDEIDQ